MSLDNGCLVVKLMGVDKDKVQGLFNHLNQNNFNFSVKNSTSQAKESIAPKKVEVPKYQVFNPEVNLVAPLLSGSAMAQLEAVGNQLLSSKLASTTPVSPNLNTHVGMFGTPEVRLAAALKIKEEEPNSEGGSPSAPLSLGLPDSLPGTRKQSSQQGLDSFIGNTISLVPNSRGSQDRTETGAESGMNLLEGHPGIVKPTPLLPNEYCFNPKSMNSTSVSGIPLFQRWNTNNHGHLGTMDCSSTNTDSIPTMANFKQVKLEVTDQQYQFGKPLSSKEYNALLFRNFPFNCTQSGIPQKCNSKLGIAKHDGYAAPNFARFGGHQLQLPQMHMRPTQADSTPANATSHRRRHSWKKSERRELNEVYQRTRYPTDEKIIELATKFSVDDYRVRSFFQRKRDLKTQ